MKTDNVQQEPPEITQTIAHIVPNPEKYLLTPNKLGHFLNNIYPFINDWERIKYVLFDPNTKIDIAITKNNEPVITASFIEKSIKYVRIKKDVEGKKEEEDKEEIELQKTEVINEYTSIVTLCTQEKVEQFRVEKKAKTIVELLTEFYGTSKFQHDSHVIYNILYTNKRIAIETP